MADLAHPLQQHLDQPHQVVGDGDDREPFDGLLQLQLKLRPAVHGFQQIEIGLLGLHAHSGGEELCGAGHAVGDIPKPVLHRDAGAHGGGEAAGHELPDGGAIAQRRLIQLADPLLHQTVIGPGRREAIAGLASERLGLASEGGEAFKQLPVLLDPAFVEHSVGRGRRASLQLGQSRPRPPGEGKGEQRQEAIALDLHQLLQDMAAEHGVRILLHHDETGETVGAWAKIGRHLRHAARNRRTDHVLGEDDGLGRLA